MGYTIFYAARNLNADETRKGISYILENYNPKIFNIGRLSDGGVLLVPGDKSIAVESFAFPPEDPEERRVFFTKTNQIQPHDQHLKALLAGLEELLRGKFAATDDYGWSVGEYGLRKELRLED